MADLKTKLRIPLGGTAAFIRFYGELNDFLSPERRGRLLVQPFHVRPSIKDVVESLGVPHPEVELMVVNHEPVDFSYSVANGDSISVYPAFHSIDLGTLPRLRTVPDSPRQFVLDVHLGRLAAYLRLLGFDCLYGNDLEDAEIVSISSSQNRTVLTRDRGLLKRSEVIHGYWVRGTEPRRQLLEVLWRFDLAPTVCLFRRCLMCNTILEPVDKHKVASRIPQRAAELFHDFHACPNCGRVYWKGSHYRRMLAFAGRTLRELRDFRSGERRSQPG